MADSEVILTPEELEVMLDESSNVRRAMIRVGKQRSVGKRRRLVKTDVGKIHDTEEKNKWTSVGKR